MQGIRQISLDSCSSYVGTPVCAVLRDGTHYYGVLGGLNEGKLWLYESVQGPGTLTVSGVKAKKRLADIKHKAATKSFGFGYPYAYPYAGAFALDAALIALLFTLPFFFI